MLITRRSMISGIERTMDLPVTEEQMQRYFNRDGYIQDIFRNLSADQREFIKTGITAEEWEETFKEDED
jgi:hypothetical protein